MMQNDMTPAKTSKVASRQRCLPLLSYISALKKRFDMNKIDSAHIEKHYKSPSIKLIALRGEAIICTSTPGLSEDEEYVL